MLEETGLEIDVGPAIWIASNYHDASKLTVGIWFEATVVGGALRAGDDAVEVGFFPLDDLPDLAFETDAELIGSLRAR